jgi:hypothetical protein
MEPIRIMNVAPSAATISTENCLRIFMKFVPLKKVDGATLVNMITKSNKANNGNRLFMLNH